MVRVMLERLVLAITLVACTPAKKPPPPVDDSPENQAFLAKIQGYTKCLDEFSTNVFKLADVYAQTHVVLSGLEDPKKCISGLADAKKLEPHDAALESKAEAFGMALAQVYALTKDKKDDPKLAGAFADFDAAHTAFFDELYKRNRAVFADQIARKEKKDGRTATVIADTVVLDAQDIVRLGAVKWDHLDAIDRQTFDTSVVGLDATLDELTAYARTHPADKNTKTTWILIDNARAFAITARQLAIRTRDRVAYSDAEKIMIAANNEASVIGTPAAMIDAYNRLLNRVPEESP